MRSFSNFDVYAGLAPGISSSILFGLDSDSYNYVALESLNGTAINGTNCNLWIAPKYGGHFSWTNQENSTAMLHESLGGVRLNGHSVGEGSTFNLVAGQTDTLEWSYMVTPLIQLNLLLGLFGLGMTCGGPFYTISKWRDDHDIKGMIAGTVITLVGAALLLGWLFT